MVPSVNRLFWCIVIVLFFFAYCQDKSPSNSPGGSPVERISKIASPRSECGERVLLSQDVMAARITAVRKN